MDMQHVLVCGGAGFIGSNFVHHLLRDGGPAARVSVLDKLTYAGNRANLAALEGRGELRFVEGDICDPEAVARAMAGCDALVNFAAETHVDRSIYGAADFIKTDVMGTYVLLEEARRLGLKRIVQISTDEVYGSVAEGSAAEDWPLEPSSPYAASKAGGDLIAKAFFKTHGVPVVTTRCSNNYGPFQYPEKVIPLFITNALEDQALPLYGDGKNVRDWIHVLDHCRAIELLLEKGAPGEVYNIGGGEERQNIEITRRILEILGKPESLIRPVKDRPGHDRRYSVDDRKIRALGWRPEVGFEEGLERTCRWYVENRPWWEAIRQKSEEYRRFYELHYKDR
jgi:dTDP-glucose 4,6-dehydratase